MMWAPEYNPYNLGTYQGRTGKRLLPCRNILYSSTITPVGLYSDYYFMKNQPVPSDRESTVSNNTYSRDIEAARSKNIDLTRKIEALRGQLQTGRTSSLPPAARQPQTLQQSTVQFFDNPPTRPWRRDYSVQLKNEDYLKRHFPHAQMGRSRGTSFTPVPYRASPIPDNGKFVLDSARPYLKRGF